MSDLLATHFAAWRNSGRKALIPYLTAGYPAPGLTLDLMRRCERAGADVIELGVPFSDPVADGTTIQRSSQIALEHGVSLDWCLEQLAAFRRESDTAVVIFSYLNPVMSYGAERFVHDAVAAGAQGVLLTDLPLGGDEALEGTVAASPLSLIRLVAPTTTTERARMIAASAQGFIYYIARMGVTGAHAELPPDLEAQLSALREVTDLPICVGFGISNPEQAAAVARIADGVVVGSALIDAMDSAGPDGAEMFLHGLRDALDGGVA